MSNKKNQPELEVSEEIETLEEPTHTPRINKDTVKKIAIGAAALGGTALLAFLYGSSKTNSAWLDRIETTETPEQIEPSSEDTNSTES